MGFLAESRIPSHAFLMASLPLPKASCMALTPSLTLSKAGLIPLFHTFEMCREMKSHTGLMTLSRNQVNTVANVLRTKLTTRLNRVFVRFHQALTCPAIQLNTALIWFHNHSHQVASCLAPPTMNLHAELMPLIHHHFAPSAIRLKLGLMPFTHIHFIH